MSRATCRNGPGGQARPCPTRWPLSVFCCLVGMLPALLQASDTVFSSCSSAEAADDRTPVGQSFLADRVGQECPTYFCADCAEPAASHSNALRPEIIAPVSAVEKALNQWDQSELSQAAKALAGVKTTSDEESLLCERWRAVALFHAVLAATDDASDPGKQEAAKKRQQQRYEDAVNALRQLLGNRPDGGAENMMLAVLYGIHIKKHPFSALSLGRRLSRHRKAALRHAATNPRVNYLEGVSLLNRADDNDEVNEAIERLLQAEAIFATEALSTADPYEPRWGRAHNAMFLGEAYERIGKTDKALDWFTQAIDAAPNLKRAREGYERCKRSVTSK